MTFEYDLFIVHAEADEPFVRGHLLPATGLAPERVMFSSALELGAIKMLELERAVQSSRSTLVVLSPAIMTDRLAEIAELLASHASGVEGRLVPLLRADCKLPPRLDFRVSLDFQDSSRWAEEGQKLRAYLQQELPTPADVSCPYPGLRPYSAETAASFYGRDVEIDELIGRLRAGEREIYVIGPSGSGKSSLVYAGVLPRLSRGVPGLGSFLTLSMRPGEQPIERLGKILEAPEGELAIPAGTIETLLARRAPSTSVLVVVDQLEELFTLASADERARFVAALRALRAEPRCILVFTLRADFYYGSFMETPLWKDLRGRLSRIEVNPLGEEELRIAIARPARDVGVYVEPELIERLLGDVGSEPGILPLLQETLIQLWDRRQLRLLTLADYQAMGDRNRSGLAIALSRHADATLRALTPEQEAIVRRILLRLISFGEGRSDTRRQQPRSKLRAANDDAADFDFVLRRLFADRLLTANEDGPGGEARVDLAHEIMITAWPALVGWIQIYRVDEQRRRQLEAVALQWIEHGRGARGLLDRIELADAEAWLWTESARELGQSTDVAALVAASRVAHNKQRKRRLVLAWSAFAALGVIAVIATLAITARLQAREAETSRKQTETALERAKLLERENQRLMVQSFQETGRRLLLAGKPQEAMPYFMAVRHKGEDRESLRMLIGVAIRFLPLIPVLEHRGAVTSAAFSPDGRRVLTVSADQTARVWDAASGKLLVHVRQAGIRSAAFSPDGGRVVTASYDDRTALIWDDATGKPLGPELQHKDGVTSAAFSPDGTRVITTSGDRTVWIWDIATGKPLGPGLQHQGLESATFSPDGARVVTTSSDHTARIWDAATGRRLTPGFQHQGLVTSAAFSPDGTRVVTRSEDHTVRIWDAATGRPLTPRLQHQGSVTSAAFSPDGTRVVTTSGESTLTKDGALFSTPSGDHTVRLWNAATGKLLASFRFRDWVWSAAFSPDGTRVVSASADTTARILDAATAKPLSPPLQHEGEVRCAAFSPDGTRVVTASTDGMARIWDAATYSPLPAIEHQGPVSSAAFSPDGMRVVSASTDHTARIWDVATRKPVGPVLEHLEAVRSAAFSSDGARVITASDDGAQIWDAITGKPVGPELRHPKRAGTAAFSPDGTRVIIVSAENTAQVWDAATGKPLAPALQHDKIVRSAAFSPDGTRVVTACDDGTTHVWDAATGKPLAPPLQHDKIVRSAAFSPDGTRVVTASDDHTARVWDAATGKPLAPALQHLGPVWSAAFSPDGSRVVTASGDHTARVWDATTGKLLAVLQHLSGVETAAFSPDGSRVVTASGDHSAQVWDAFSGAPLTPGLVHPRAVRSVAFSPDGTHVLTVSGDNTVRVWSIQLDETPPEGWSDLAARSSFVLSGHVHVLRGSLAGIPGPVPDVDRGGTD